MRSTRAHRTNEVDKYVGQRIRAERQKKGMTQGRLGAALDRPVTFQQIQKYESGADRVVGSRLHEIAIVLEVNPGTFFPFTPFTAGALTRVNGLVSISELVMLVDQPDTVRVLRALKPLTGKHRKTVVEFVEAYAATYASYSPT
jgi:transcriptional regulator with XRE-family HTH domain